ncbi:conserved hypothetical protein [Brochothrix thermosphacta]|nr:conserved hypothetical protein [Brochothrix thermosphacta]
MLLIVAITLTLLVKPTNLYFPLIVALTELFLKQEVLEKDTVRC